MDLTETEKTLLEGTLKMMLDVVDAHTTRLRELTDRVSVIERIIKER